MAGPGVNNNPHPQYFVNEARKLYNYFILIPMVSISVFCNKLQDIFKSCQELQTIAASMAAMALTFILNKQIFLIKRVARVSIN